MDILEMLGLGRSDPQTEPERLAVESLPSAAVTGGLGGILAASVLGGPAGLGIGLATGLLSKRFRDNLIDRTAADIQSTTRFGNRITEQLQGMVPYAQEFGSELDVSELQDIAASVARYQELANHHDPQVRAQALSSMMAQDSRIDAFKTDLQNRTRVEADRVWNARKERAAELRSAVEFENESLTELAVNSESLLQMVSDLGIDSPAVQAKAREYANFTLAEAEAGGANVSLNLGIASASFNQLDYKFTEQEIYKMVSGRQKAVGNIRRQRIAELMQQAEQDGFAVNNTDGEWSVEDANLTIQNFRSDVPPVEMVKPSEVRQASPIQGGRGASKVRPSEGPKPDPLQEWFQSQAAQDREFVEGRRNRRQRRETN